jgi:hypothetical protein
MLEGDAVTALSVALLDIGRKDDADARQPRDDGRRDSRNRIVQILLQVLFGDRYRRKITELGGDWNHLPADAQSEAFHG